MAEQIETKMYVELLLSVPLCVIVNVGNSPNSPVLGVYSRTQCSYNKGKDEDNDHEPVWCGSKNRFRVGSVRRMRMKVRPY